MLIKGISKVCTSDEDVAEPVAVIASTTTKDPVNISDNSDTDSGLTSLSYLNGTVSLQYRINLSMLMLRSPSQPPTSPNAIALPTVPRTYSERRPSPFAGPETDAWIVENISDKRFAFRLRCDLVEILESCRPDQYEEQMIAMGYKDLDNLIYHLQKCLQKDRVHSNKTWKEYNNYRTTGSITM